MRTSSTVIALCALAGFTTISNATVLEYQVSRALAEDWHSSIEAKAGDAIDIRVRVSYTGTASPLGLGQVIFQPTVSNWLTTDAMAPLVNNGVGSQTTTPIGAVVDAPGQYGRVIPFGAPATTATSFYKGHVNTAPDGIRYLRVAQAQVTSWFGGTGNTTGGSGVVCYQLNDLGRNANTPPFNPSLTDIVVFKFSITLSSTSLDLRTMLVDTPLLGLGSRDSDGRRTGHWYATMLEPSGTIRDIYDVHPASIFVNVPAPGAIGLSIGSLAIALRRRRR
jgi:hypothetical protein